MQTATCSRALGFAAPRQAVLLARGLTVALNGGCTTGLGPVHASVMHRFFQLPRFGCAMFNYFFFFLSFLVGFPRAADQCFFHSSSYGSGRKINQLLTYLDADAILSVYLNRDKGKQGQPRD